MLSRSALLCFGALAPLVAARAQALLPVHPAAIQPYVTMWRVAVIEPDGTRKAVGLWSDEVSRESYQGRPVIRRVQGMTFANGQSATWINVLDAATLRPIMDVEHGRDAVWTRHFADSAVETRREHTDGRAVDSSRSIVRGPVYDYHAGAYGLLFASLPLTVGYGATFLSIGGAKDSLRTIALKVVGRESVRAGCGRKVDAWKVVEGDLTYYIADEAPYIIRLVESLPDGGLMIWELP